MPRLVNKVPSYRHHKSSGQAVVTLHGKDHYLGVYNSDESRERYNQLIAEWLTAGRQVTPKPCEANEDDAESSPHTINEVFLAYWRFVEGYYVKNGEPTGEQQALRYALKPLVSMYGRTPINEFGPIQLKAVRRSMIKSDWARTLINARVNRIRRMFKWGVENQYVEAGVLHALQAVAPLKRGRCEARETAPVKPIADAYVEAVFPFLSRQVVAMIRLQALTGMRPGEVVIMRGFDLDTSGQTWFYKPESHKSEHHGHERLIFIGPRAQGIIRPFLKRDMRDYLFSPAEAEAERRARQRQRRKTPRNQGNRPGTNKRQRPSKTPGRHYTVDSYRQAIQKACDKAFPHPELSSVKQKDLTDEQRDELKQWRKDHRWHPHQLRHNAGTHLRKQFGIEVARIVLGHRHIETTELYAEANIQKAIEVMRKIG